MREKEGINAPLLCRQCKQCLSACKRDALSWDEGISVVRVDRDKCNGCGLCIEACAYAAIQKDPVTKKVNICDLCNGDPQCVKWCTAAVLSLTGGVRDASQSETTNR
jgi:Fe-S-cluster-containing dehydrogenase component